LGVTANEGVVVADVLPDSPAARAGLKRDDVIVRVGDQGITDPSELRDVIQKLGAGKEVKISVLRGKEKREVTARLDESPVEGITPFPFPVPLPGGGGGRAVVPSILGSAERVRELEQKVNDLEKRIQELEKRNPQPK